MKTSVELQEPFRYMPVWLIIAIACVLVCIFLQVFFRLRYKGMLRKEKELKVVKPRPEALVNKKRRYLRELDRLEQNVASGRISVRDGFQRMSVVIRLFVYEATRIRVQDYTLSEIRTLNMPALTQLVAEYYEPEFAEYSVTDIRQSLYKTRRVIEAWN